MNRDPRFALSQELEAKQSLLDQLRALAADDPDLLTDLIEGETNLLELIAALDASIVDDETLIDGAKAALDKLQARKRTGENRIERRLLAHTLQQIGLKTLRTPTATLTLAEASLKAIAVAPEVPGALVEAATAQTRSRRAHQGNPRPRQSAQGGRGPHGPGETPPGAGRDRGPPPINPRRHRLEWWHHPHSEGLTVRPIIPGGPKLAAFPA